MKTFTVALVLLATTAAPASAQNRREMQMMADIRMLQEQNQQMQVALTALGEALKAINSRFDEQASITRKGFADQGLKMDQFGSELRVVREGVSEAGVRIGQLSQELEAVRLSIPQYPPPVPPTDPSADPAAAADPAATGVPPVAGSATTPAPAPVGPGVSPQRMFDTTLADYYAGQYDLCVTGFEMYIQTFPRSELASQAQHLVGECHYLKGDHQAAVAAYSQVITNYPRTESAADSYYKRGLALERLKQLDQARASFEDAIKNHPDSAAARLSKQALDRLKGKPPA